MKEKIKIEKDGFTFNVESESAIDALNELYKSNPGHSVFSDCRDGIFRGFFITCQNTYPC